MSLINEALRKARQAASDREAKPPQGAFRPAKAYPSRRSGRGGGLLAVGLIAVVAAAVGAASAWWLLGGRGHAAGEGPPIAAGPIAVPASSPVAEVSPTAHDEPAAPAPAAAVPQQAAPQAVTPVIAAPIATAEDIGEDGPKPQPATAAPEKQARGPAGERVFVVEADLGYAVLELGFIVARAGNPFAEINGVEVSVGSEIEGFTVEAIEADRVVLRDAKGPLVLRVP